MSEHSAEKDAGWCTTHDRPLADCKPVAFAGINGLDYALITGSLPKACSVTSPVRPAP